MNETENKIDQLFLNLVLSLHSAAMQQMGKLKNPMTDTIDRNLGQAELSIDMLDVIKKKTEGNLSEEEDKFLTLMLNELKMNFMDEKNKGEDMPPEESAKDGDSEDKNESSDIEPKEEDLEEKTAEKSGEEE